MFLFLQHFFSTFSSSSRWVRKTRVTVLMKRISHITDNIFMYFSGELEPQHLRGAGTVCRIGSELPSTSTQTPTTANQMKPGGQTRCPLRLIYCCSKETLTADHRQVRRVLESAAWRVRLNFLYTHIVASYRDVFTVNLEFALDFLHVSTLKNNKNLSSVPLLWWVSS